MPAVSERMIIDAVDPADRPIGTISRSRVFSEHANFRVSHVWVFNSSRELLLQRLAFDRMRNPGAWGSSVASYLFSTETYQEAAVRRVREELGVSPSGLKLLVRTEMEDDGCLKFISVFGAIHDGPFRIDYLTSLRWSLLRFLTSQC